MVANVPVAGTRSGLVGWRTAALHPEVAVMASAAAVAAMGERLRVMAGTVRALTPATT